MMISVPDKWDSCKLDELHGHLKPAYAAERIVINLVGVRHVTDTLLAELLELRNHREHRELEAALIIVNSPFVHKLLELAGFLRPLRIFDSVKVPVWESLVALQTPVVALQIAA